MPVPLAPAHGGICARDARHRPAAASAAAGGLLGTGAVGARVPPGRPIGLGSAAVPHERHVCPLLPRMPAPRRVVPSAMVHVLSADAPQRAIMNVQATGPWTVRRGLPPFRVLNHTKGCTGPKLVIFAHTGPLSQASSANELSWPIDAVLFELYSAALLDTSPRRAGDFTTFRLRRGTLVPVPPEPPSEATHNPPLTAPLSPLALVPVPAAATLNWQQHTQPIEHLGVGRGVHDRVSVRDLVDLVACDGGTRAALPAMDAPAALDNAGSASLMLAVPSAPPSPPALRQSSSSLTRTPAAASAAVALLAVLHRWPLYALAGAVGILGVALTELRNKPAFQLAVAMAAIALGAMLVADKLIRSRHARIGSAVAIVTPAATCFAAVAVGLLNLGYICEQIPEELSALRTRELEASPEGIMVVAGSFGAYLGLQPATHLAPAPKWLTVALLLLLALCADAVLWAPPAPTPASLWCFLHPPLPLHFGGGRLTFPLPTIEHPFCVPLLTSAAALDCAQHLASRWTFPSSASEQRLSPCRRAFWAAPAV